MRDRFRRLLLALAVPATASAMPTGAKGEATEMPARSAAAEQACFTQIPGPSPVLKPGEAGDWDSGVIEAADAFKDSGTYCFYYHGTGARGYQLGVATAPGPLGPFTKHGNAPILAVGPKGSWDDVHVACAMVLKETDERFLMWYSGHGGEAEEHRWDIGLATAPSPLGPWTKHPANPILEDFGYVGGVIKAEGEYRLYSAWPISSPGYKNDYSPLALATAAKPEGPYEKCPANPLMEKGAPGDWDGGGISEAEVLFQNGMYHMFYGGTQHLGHRLESIGYAWSVDGVRFRKFGRNPVAGRQANPNAAAFAEVHAIMEPPFIYLYHTLRYEGLRDHAYPWVEHLGVQVLATQRPFGLEMPVLTVDTLGPGCMTSLEDSPPVCLSNVASLALSLHCTYAARASTPARLHVRSSHNGVTWDTTDLCCFEGVLQPGRRAIQTFPAETSARVVKVLVENPDERESITSIRVVASLKG